MALEIVTIGDLCGGGDRLPKTLVVVRKRGNRGYVVDEVIKGEDGKIVVRGAYTENNRSRRLNQDTKVFDFFIGRSNERLSLICLTSLLSLRYK